MSFNLRLWYHPESDSYYTGGPEETDGLAEDVTGIERHVENAKARGIDMADIREKLTKDQMLESVSELLKPVITRTLHEATRTCLTCDYFAEHNGENCTLYNQRPPARVIAFGCPSYVNEIPF